MAERFKPCSVHGCNGNSHSSANGAKGFCQRHYLRLLRHGDPQSGGPTRTPRGEAKRFLSEVVMNYDGDECLIWPYHRCSAGYGRIDVDGYTKLVSRIVCERVNGPPLMSEHEAAHSCGKGHLGCVTKGHLSWETPSQNGADKVAHGTSLKGERSPNAKLTEHAVREIKALQGYVSQRELARRYGVSRRSIEGIYRGDVWGWL